MSTAEDDMLLVLVYELKFLSTGILLSLLSVISSIAYILMNDTYVFPGMLTSAEDHGKTQEIACFKTNTHISIFLDRNVLTYLNTLLNQEYYLVCSGDILPGPLHTVVKTELIIESQGWN